MRLYPLCTISCSLRHTFHTVYPDGLVCISILVGAISNLFPSVAELTSPFHSTKHAPGDDQYGYEDAGERWMPVHSIESIVRVTTHAAIIVVLTRPIHPNIVAERHFPPII